MCKINCNGGCRECAPEDHLEEYKLLLKESLVHLKNLNEYPWSDFPDVTEATEFINKLEKLLND